MAISQQVNLLQETFPLSVSNHTIRDFSWAQPKTSFLVAVSTMRPLVAQCALDHSYLGCWKVLPNSKHRVGHSLNEREFVVFHYSHPQLLTWATLMIGMYRL